MNLRARLAAKSRLREQAEEDGKDSTMAPDPDISFGGKFMMELLRKHDERLPSASKLLANKLTKEASPSPAAGGALQPGAFVTAVGLSSRNEDLNGQQGVILEEVDGGSRWTVSFASGNKVLRAENLVLATDQGEGEPPKPTDWRGGHAASTASAARAPPGAPGGSGRGDVFKVPLAFIVGTWNRWTPTEMTWDEDRECYQAIVHLGHSAKESFQLLIDADWRQSLHPAGSDKYHFSIGKLQGPDNHGQGLVWTIGKDPSDVAAPGAGYEVRLFYDVEHRRFRSIDWVQLNSSKDARTAKTAFSSQAMFMMMKAARPDWRDGDVKAVVERLARVNLHSSIDVVAMLNADDGGALNQRLKASGEKGFLQATVQALRSHSNLVSGASTGMKPKEAKPAPPQEVGEPQTLPTVRLKVVASNIPIHEQPRSRLALLGYKSRGQVVDGIVETCDGWVRLSGEVGWLPLETDSKVALAPLRDEDKLAWTLEDSREREGGVKFTVTFTVVYKPQVVVRASPFKTASVVAIKKHGDEVIVDAQTYNSWVHLSDDSGWMLRSDSALGLLLEPKP